MLSTDTSSYYPTIFIEGWSTVDFAYEFHAIDARIYCPSCPSFIFINDVKNSILGNPFPNPANTEINITFTVIEAANVNVTISNTIGQVLMSQAVNKVSANEHKKVSFNTSSLASGVYFYTVEVNGQRNTSRFVVSH